MSISTVPADQPDPLAGFDREVDLPARHESLAAPRVADSPDKRNPTPTQAPRTADPPDRRNVAPAPAPGAAEPPISQNPLSAAASPATSSRPRLDALSPWERAVLREARASRRRTWLLYGCAALALIQVPFVVMWMLQSPAPSGTAPTADVVALAPAVAATDAPPPGAKPVLGTIEIVTEPAQAAISVDGSERGSAPVTVTGLTAGTHTVTAQLGGRNVQRQIRVEPGSTASLLITMPQPAGAVSGWISVDVPASFQILEGGRLVGNTDVDRLMLPVGRHSLEFVSEELGFRTQQTVTVNPGATSSVRLELPQASLSINAQPWAEVWIAGERIGETPLGDVSRPIGRHEVVFRHPSLGERTVSVLVTLKEPARIAVDLRTSK